jgi:hypothetical protein
MFCTAMDWPLQHGRRCVFAYFIDSLVFIKLSYLSDILIS